MQNLSQVLERTKHAWKQHGFLPARAGTQESMSSDAESLAILLRFTSVDQNENSNPSPAPSAVNVLDPHGDLRLVVGDSKTVFQVCSRALARSSSVWEAMLYGPLSEGKTQQKGNDWEIALPEDLPEPFEMLLCAVHSNFDVLPKKLSGSAIVDILVLSDKHDMIRSLKPCWSS